ncbi:hypothetical protein JW949_00820 [Candidatus Woesearchaeota archaeon]|nr:hypothetical protein [Candidatus Woesearchaeota archaeon]
MGEAIYPSNFSRIIKIKGVVNWSEVYGFIKAWFKNKRYDIHETTYKDKPDSVEGTNKLECAITAERKIDEYYMFQISVAIKGWGLIPIKDKTKNNKSIYKGRIRFIIDTWVVEDYDNIMEHGAVAQKLKYFLRRTVKGRMTNCVFADYVHYETVMFINDLKKILDLYAESEAFRQKIG